MTQRGNAQNDGRNRGAGPDGRPKAAPTRALFRFRRGGLWPPADPRRDTHHPGGGRIERPLFSVPPHIGRNGRGRSPTGAYRRKPPRCHANGPGLKSPFFFGSQKTFLSSPHPERLPQSPSVTAPSEREPKGAPSRRAPHAEEPHFLPRHSEAAGRRIRISRPWLPLRGSCLRRRLREYPCHAKGRRKRILRCRFVLAKSASLCFRLAAKTRSAPLLVLSPRKAFRLSWGPHICKVCAPLSTPSAWRSGRPYLPSTPGRRRAMRSSSAYRPLRTQDIRLRPSVSKPSFS